MKNRIEIVDVRGGLEVYRRLDDGIYLVFAQKKKKVFIIDRYNIKQEFLSSGAINVSDQDYNESVAQVMAVLRNRFNVKDLRFISKPYLSKVKWLELSAWRNAGISILPNGKIGVRYWKKVRNKLKSYERGVKDIDAAIRMQDKILAKYWERNKANPRLNETDLVYLAQKIFSIVNDMFLIWDEAEFDERVAVQKKLQFLIDSLKGCRNEQKILFELQAKKIILLKDKLKRDNPSALAARCIGAINSILKRLKGIHNMSLKITLRRELLIAKRNYIEDQRFKAIKVLESLLRAKPQNISNYLSGLHKAIFFLRDINMRPYSPNSLKAKVILREAYKGYKFFSHEEIQEQIGLALKVLKNS